MERVEKRWPKNKKDVFFLDNKKQMVGLKTRYWYDHLVLYKENYLKNEQSGFAIWLGYQKGSPPSNFDNFKNGEQFGLCINFEK